MWTGARRVTRVTVGRDRRELGERREGRSGDGCRQSRDRVLMSASDRTANGVSSLWRTGLGERAAGALRRGHVCAVSSLSICVPAARACRTTVLRTVDVSGAVDAGLSWAQRVVQCES